VIPDDDMPLLRLDSDLMTRLGELGVSLEVDVITAADSHE
jgi:hypothetical protein